MPTYEYRGTTSTGTVTTGKQDASDVASLVTALRNRGVFPSEINDVTKAKTTSAFSKKISIPVMSIFCTQLASVLGAGVPLSTGLDIIREQIEDREMRRILDDVYSKIQQGRTLTDAFSNYRNQFPNMFINMLEAGEMSGNLDMCLGRAGITFTKQKRINDKIRGAMIYPMVLLCLTILVAGGLVVFIVPMFSGMLEAAGGSLPWSTRLLVSMSDWLQAYWHVFLISIALVVTSFRVWLSSPKGRLTFDTFLLKIPKVGPLLFIIAAGRYTRTLSAMSAAGVPLAQALEVTARSMGNKFLQVKIEGVLEEIKMGATLSAPLARSKAVPDMICHMTRLGEESGTLDHLMDQSADYYEDQSDSAITKLTAMLEPAIIVVMGVVVCFVVISILIPMFDSVLAQAG